MIVHFPGARDSTCAPTGGFTENVQGDSGARVCVEDLLVRGVCWGADGVCVGLRTQVGYVCQDCAVGVLYPASGGNVR